MQVGHTDDNGVKARVKLVSSQLMGALHSNIGEVTIKFNYFTSTLAKQV